MEEDILDQEIGDPKNQPLFKTRPILIWGILLIIGLLFRVMHWPFASVLIIISPAGLQAYCVNGFLKPKERNILNTLLSSAGMLWLIVMIGGVLLNNGHPYNENGLKVYAVTFTLFFVLYYFFYRAKKNRLNATINE
jgi:cytochrome b subunit of formate dehydrogenase